MNQKLYKHIQKDDLKDLVHKLSPKNIFLVTGKGSFFKSGANSFIEPALNGFNYIHYYDFEENPKYEDVVLGISLFIKHNCDLVIAIGGGSVLDMAKLINIFSANPQKEYLNIINDNTLIVNKGKTLIAIPTTAGTGCEATHFAVVYHHKVKYSVSHKFILPEVVGLNYNLTITQPKYLSACAGLDALSQAIESFWSNNSTTESKKYATEAILLLIQSLENRVLEPTEENIKAVSLGAYLAGKAINISKTTAPHAISYAFTSYFSIPHGHAVFLTLPKFIEYNFHVTNIDIADSRGENYVRNNIGILCNILGVNSPKEAENLLRELVQKIGIELSLSKIGINNKEDIKLILENINMERLKNNPRKIKTKHLIEMFY